MNARAACVCLGVVLFAGCTATIGDPSGSSGGNTALPAATGGGAGTSGSAGKGSTPPASGGTTSSGGGGSMTTAGSSGTGSAAGGSGPSGSTLPTLCANQSAVTPGRAPLRRLTKVEYNNTVHDLLGDTTQPAYALPTELSGNGFGNDADQQPVPQLLAEGYAQVAAELATRATASSTALATLHECTSGVTSSNEATCARSIIEKLAPKAYRRPLVAGESDDFVKLFSDVRTNDTFAGAVAAMLEAMLQSPDFLYRVEFGKPDTANAALKRPTGYEMATRLSYLFWGTMPDATLTQAAASGALDTSEGVRTQAERLVEDPRTRAVVGYFFDALLPLTGLTDEARDPAQFPTFSSTIGSLMLKETRTYLEHEVFDGPGTWTGILTEPYTYVNAPLAAFYGIEGVTGDDFQKVPVDTSQRLGLLLQGGLMTGTTVTNFTNPVRRGAFVINQLMCRGLEVPVGLAVTPPDPYSAKTGRERYSIHSMNDACKGCHHQLDPMGFALENYDSVGLFRATENGETIDASGEIPDMPNGEVSGPIELVQKLAQNEEVQNCFASKWLDFGYGQTLSADNPDDVCQREALAAQFRSVGFNVKRLLVELTQTDGFLYLGSQS
jgi:hypothetical protein